MMNHCSVSDDSDESDGENIIEVPLPEGKPDLTKWIRPPTDEYWTNNRSCKLHLRHWAPAPRKVRGALFYVHGYAGHINRPTLDVFLKRIAAAGYVVFAFDIRGHGYSPGERCLVRSFADVLDDFVTFAELVYTADAPEGDGYNLGCSDELLDAVQNVRFGVMGESMGGALALLLATRFANGCVCGDEESFIGAVAMSPALSVGLPPPWMQAVLRNTVVPIMPSSPMPQWVSSGAQADISEVIRDEKVAAYAVLDDWEEAQGALGWRKPMKWGTAGAFSQMYSTIESDMAEMDFPFLVLHDPDDTICDYSGTLRLMELSPSEDKQCVEVAGGLHAISFNELELTVSKVVAFFSSRL